VRAVSPQTQLVQGMAEVGEHALAEEYRQQLGLPLDTLAPPDPGEACSIGSCCIPEAGTKLGAIQGPLHACMLKTYVFKPVWRDAMVCYGEGTKMWCTNSVLAVYTTILMLWCGVHELCWVFAAACVVQ
jgi:hypothetical protein